MFGIRIDCAGRDGGKARAWSRLLVEAYLIVHRRRQRVAVPHGRWSRSRDMFHVKWFVLEIEHADGLSSFQSAANV